MPRGGGPTRAYPERCVLSFTPCHAARWHRNCEYLDGYVHHSVTRDNALQANIDTEAAARLAADEQFGVGLANEVTARTNSANVLQQAIADEAAARTAAVSAEATTRAAADTMLQSNIDAEALARTNADATHTAAIAQEVTDRGIAVTCRTSHF